MTWKCLPSDDAFGLFWRYFTENNRGRSNGGDRWLLKFRLDRIYSFGDIAIFMSLGFGFNRLFTWLYIRRACAESMVSVLPGRKLTTYFDL